MGSIVLLFAAFRPHAPEVKDELCAALWAAARMALAWNLGERVHGLVYRIAAGIVWFAVTACVVLALIYLVQLCWQRPRR
jgi:hypothetical protein